MITLYAFGPFLGSPDSSPFVTKAMALLRMAGAPHRVVLGMPFAGPHQFLPYIVDGGLKIPDTCLIREHLERAYGFDFDGGLSPVERATAWAIARMCEDHLYFAMLRERWLDDGIFRAGLGRYMFDRVPAPARPLARAMLRRMNASRLKGQGLGRHKVEDIRRLGARDISALAALLGARPFLMGERPCGADASVFGLVDAILTPPLATPLRSAIEAHANLVAYRDRFASQFFPELVPEANARASA